MAQEAVSAHVVPPEFGRRYHSNCDRLGVPQTDFVLVGRFQTDIGGRDRVAQLLGEQFAEQFQHGRLRVLVGQPVADPARVGPDPGRSLVETPAPRSRRPAGPAVRVWSDLAY